MPRLKPYKISGYLLFIAYFGVLLFPSDAQSFSHFKFSADRVAWTGLSFHAKNFWVEVSTDVQLVSMPATETQTLMISTPKGTPIKSSAAETTQITINTTIDPRFRSSVNIYNRIWFNPADAAALGRVRLRRGDGDFKKIYRFTEQGVFRHRIEPKNKNEASLDPEKWTDIYDSFYRYDVNRLGCSRVSERSLPIYILSAIATSEPTGSLSLCVFGKRQLHRVTLRHAGEQPIRVSFIENKKQVETQKQGLVRSIKFILISEPMESDLNEDENFSFLGFHKDISIYVDPASGLPIQASGIIPTAGKATLKLKKVWFKN